MILLRQERETGSDHEQGVELPPGQRSDHLRIRLAKLLQPDPDHRPIRTGRHPWSSADSSRATLPVSSPV